MKPCPNPECQSTETNIDRYRDYFYTNCEKCSVHGPHSYIDDVSGTGEQQLVTARARNEAVRLWNNLLRKGDEDVQLCGSRN